ncbi:MAG: GNAT family N-acetyltransferase [Planctomycetota bacterium]|jgi:putative acetyltransferase
MQTIRDYKPDDNDRILFILKTALIEYGLAVDTQTTDSDILDVQKNYFNSNGSFRILEDSSEIIGMYGLYPIDPSTCELRKMYLLPALKGRGYGKLLMDDALIIAEKLSYKKMVLETNSRLIEAIGLYKKYGFKQYNPPHLSHRCDYAMQKIL